MKWFKHMSNANRNEHLCALKALMGMEGYGMYWSLLELIAENMDEKNDTKIRYSEVFYRKFFAISDKKLQKFFKICANFKLFSIEFQKNSEKNPGDFVTIDCPKMLEHRDDWTIRQSRKLRSDSEAALGSLRLSYIEEDVDIEKDPPLPPRGRERLENKKTTKKHKEKEFTEDPPVKTAILKSIPVEVKRSKAVVGKEKDSLFFENFWKFYPKKVGKAAVRQHWETKGLDKQAAEIEKALKSQLNQEQWSRDNGRYIPYPLTWLNQERWKDEIQEATSLNGNSPSKVYSPAQLQLIARKEQILSHTHFIRYGEKISRSQIEEIPGNINHVRVDGSNVLVDELVPIESEVNDGK